MSKYCGGCGVMAHWPKGPCDDCGYVACHKCRKDPRLGTCDCPFSNFGTPYSHYWRKTSDFLERYAPYEEDGYGGGQGPAPVMAAGRDGTVYAGPVKCRAQLALERYLLGDKSAGERDPLGLRLGPAPREYVTLCGARACKTRVLEGSGAKRCGRCKSAVYCSATCAANDWARRHKAQCGPYLGAADLPYVSLAIREYEAKFGRPPTARAPPPGAVPPPKPPPPRPTAWTLAPGPEIPVMPAAAVPK